MLRAIVLVALFALPSSAALADRADADACAAKLKGQTKGAYRSIVENVQRGPTLEAAGTRGVKPKVDRGRVTESEARRSGRGAGE